MMERLLALKDTRQVHITCKNGHYQVLSIDDFKLAYNAVIDSPEVDNLDFLGPIEDREIPCKDCPATVEAGHFYHTSGMEYYAICQCGTKINWQHGSTPPCPNHTTVTS